MAHWSSVLAKLPQGATLNRQIAVTVQPDAVVVDTMVGLKLPPTKVDLSLVDMPDRTRRVVASSPDGMVTGALDIPVALIPETRKWAAGLSSSTTRMAGLWIERDIGRMRLGVDLNQTRTGPEIRARVGFTW